MSILDNNDPVVVREPAAKRAARNLINQARETYNQMVSAFNNGAQTFWANSAGVTPSDIAAELGTNAKEVFELHYKLGQFIASVKPEAVIEGNSLVGNFTMNEDGTVTVLNSHIISPIYQPYPESESKLTTTPEPAPE